MAYEEIETAWIWDYTFECTRTQGQELERFFKEQPEDLECEVLRARIHWAQRHGTEERCAELAIRMHALELQMYDKAKAKARSLETD